MLSKSRGQILRMAATMHVLFHWETPGEIPSTISSEALKAAQSFVEHCTQHGLDVESFLAKSNRFLIKVSDVQACTSTCHSQKS